MVYRLIIIAFLLGGCSVMEIATDAALIVDGLQTRQFPGREDVYEKDNLILPEDATKDEIDAYFASALILNTIIHREWTWFPKANYYRKKALPYYQGGLLGIQLKCIDGNNSLGVHVKFTR